MTMLFAALGFAAGIVLAAYGAAAWQFAAAGTGLVGLAWVGGRHRIPAIALACGVAAGAWRFSALADSAPRRDIVEYVRTEKHPGIRGTVVAEPDCKSDRALVLSVRVEAVRSARYEWAAVAPVTVEAVLLAGRGTNRPPVGASVPELASPAAFGYGVELNRVRLSVAPSGQPPARRSAGPPVVLLHWSGARIRERSSGWPPLEAALALKIRLLASFARNLDDVPARLAAGMALGDKAAVYAASWRGVPLRDLFARAGTAHLLAVSAGCSSVRRAYLGCTPSLGPEPAVGLRHSPWVTGSQRSVIGNPGYAVDSSCSGLLHSGAWRTTRGQRWSSRGASPPRRHARSI